jgi:hypothetical protein
VKRILLFAIVAVIAALAIPMAAGATHSEGTGPKSDKANGTGESPTAGRIHVNAKDGADGPRGHFFIGPASGPVAIQGDVTCLTVSGNTALVGGFDRSTGMAWLIEVVDNGEPGAGADHHRSRMATPGEVSAPDCDPFGNAPPRQTITQGNYVVHGAS